VGSPHVLFGQIGRWVGALAAPLAGLARGGQQPVHRRDRAQVNDSLLGGARRGVDQLQQVSHVSLTGRGAAHPRTLDGGLAGQDTAISRRWRFR
jgi:hypothetical protein